MYVPSEMVAGSCERAGSLRATNVDKKAGPNRGDGGRETRGANTGQAGPKGRGSGPEATQAKSREHKEGDRAQSAHKGPRRGPAAGGRKARGPGQRPKSQNGGPEGQARGRTKQTPKPPKANQQTDRPADDFVNKLELYAPRLEAPWALQTTGWNVVHHIVVIWPRLAAAHLDHIVDDVHELGGVVDEELARIVVGIRHIGASGVG